MNFPTSGKDRCKLWIAEGFGIGRLRHAPGTWGSLLGVAWTLALLTSGSVWIYALGSFAGLVLSVWLCGAAERILTTSDPGSVVLDEIAAFPLCLVPLIAALSRHGDPLPAPAVWMRMWHGWFFPAAFALFRLFDIWKPTPIRQSQNLAGGWGVTTDDVLAAVVSGFVILLIHRLS